MLWSPIVKASGDKAKFNQMADIEAIAANIQAQYGVTLKCIINEKFAACLEELRAYARHSTKELKSPVLRLRQVEEYGGRI